MGKGPEAGMSECGPRGHAWHICAGMSAPSRAVLATARCVRAGTFMRTHCIVRAVNLEVPQSWI